MSLQDKRGQGCAEPEAISVPIRSNGASALCAKSIFAPDKHGNSIGHGAAVGSNRENVRMEKVPGSCKADGFQIRTTAAWCFILTVGVALLYIGRDVLVPIALSVLIWFLINALAATLRKGPVLASVLGPLSSRAIAVLLFLGVVVFTGRVVADNLARIATDLDPETSPILAKLIIFAQSLGMPSDVSLNWLFGIYPLDQFLGNAVSLVRGLISDASLIFLYVMFLLLDERFFDAKLKALFPNDAHRTGVRETISHVSQEARIYLWLMFLISLGVGLVTFFFCSAFGVKGAAFWGFLAFGLNFIPTIGSILAVVIPCLYALLTFDNPIALGGLIACLSATQFIAGEIVLPRLMGDHLNLSAFVVLLSLVVWGVLWGPVGMFLGIPITVIAVVLCTRMDRTRPIAILLSKDGRVPKF